MSADTSEIDAAVMAKLSGDATLMGLMPDGVYWGVAKSGATKFVLVSYAADPEVAYTMPWPAWESLLYLVKATMPGTSGTDVKAAAKRIRELLHDTTITPVGYYPSMLVRYVQPVRYTEVDEQTDERWQHRGGHYHVMACPK